MIKWYQLTKRQEPLVDLKSLLSVICICIGDLSPASPMELENCDAARKHWNFMVYLIFILSLPVEATAYISAVAAFAALILVVLLFLGRRWCHSTVFSRTKLCDDILAINHVAGCLPLDNAQFGKSLRKLLYVTINVLVIRNSNPNPILITVKCRYKLRGWNLTAWLKLTLLKKKKKLGTCT